MPNFCITGTFLFTFRIQGFVVIVTETMMGATCCGEETFPDEEKCPTCCQSLRHVPVYRFRIPDIYSIAIDKTRWRHIKDAAELEAICENVASRYVNSLIDQGTLKRLPPIPERRRIDDDDEDTGDPDDEDDDDIDDEFSALEESIAKSGWDAIAQEIHDQLKIG